MGQLKNILNHLLSWGIRQLIPRYPMATDLSPETDGRHDLQNGEHEAFYFLAGSPDGKITLGVRTLFSNQDVLEIIGLKFGSFGWIYQHQTPTPLTLESNQASGPALNLTCRTPWQSWEIRFSGEMISSQGNPEPIALDLTFQSLNPAALYRLGNYHQAQQDGYLIGKLHMPQGDWEGELIGYRDHSWGKRGAGNIPGWMILDAPEHFYIFIVGDLDLQPLSFGRFRTPDGHFIQVREPEIKLEKNGWRIEDRRAGLLPWHFERLGPAGISYLGNAGEEAVRNHPSTGDRFRDEIGPALFTSSDGKTCTGFWDQATHIPIK